MPEPGFIQGNCLRRIPRRLVLQRLPMAQPGPVASVRQQEEKKKCGAHPIQHWLIY